MNKQRTLKNVWQVVNTNDSCSIFANEIFFKPSVFIVPWQKWKATSSKAAGVATRKNSLFMHLMTQFLTSYYLANANFHFVLIQITPHFVLNIQQQESVKKSQYKIQDSRNWLNWKNKGPFMYINYVKQPLIINQGSIYYILKLMNLQF